MSEKSHSETFNRIFILGGKQLTLEELKGEFIKFGSITGVIMLKEKSGENRGINYITYEKASEAAMAIEKMNGQLVCGIKKPIKVLLANDRNSGNAREPEEEDKMKRLFICVPNNHDHEDVTNYFQKYGRVGYVKILPMNSRGIRLAFVKFDTAYQAAVALENCDEVYKARFAETIWTSRRIRAENQLRRMESQGLDSTDAIRSKRFREDHKNQAESSRHRNREKRSRATGGHSLLAKMSSHLSPSQVFKLFDLQPGLESCDYNPQTGLVHASYLDYPFMERAKEKLQSFEYPPGHQIQFTDNTLGGVQDDSNNVSMEQSFKALIQTIEKAAAVIQNSNIALKSSNGNSFASSSSHSDDSYKAGLLSSPKEISRHHDDRLHSPIAEQLHFTSTPGLIPVDVLTGLFCRFGNLLKVEYVPGGCSGIASFTCRESAQEASKSLNGCVKFGNRLKILQSNNFLRPDERRNSLRNSSH